MPKNNITGIFSAGSSCTGIRLLSLSEEGRFSQCSIAVKGHRTKATLMEVFNVRLTYSLEGCSVAIMEEHGSMLSARAAS